MSAFPLKHLTVGENDPFLPSLLVGMCFDPGSQLLRFQGNHLTN